MTRGVAAASASTSIAAFSHVMAGGPTPDAAIVLFSLALSLLVCTALAGHALSLWRLCTAVVVSQGVYHSLFSLGSSSSGVEAVAPASGHATHSASPVLDHAITNGVMDHSVPTMWLGHIVAAALTIALLPHGEVTLMRLLRVFGLKLVPFLRFFQPLAIAPAAPLSPANWPVRPLRNLGAPLLVMRHRGPPLLPVAS
ncbi:hypothetical protein [Paenarthrobacter nitroguajacolicus]|uniref:hypothetical protein n=1 Tax=Paenarthrobacter nitroguajacolicus TaxID=211146 RepID=UPI0034460C64